MLVCRSGRLRSKGMVRSRTRPSWGSSDRLEKSAPRAEVRAPVSIFTRTRRTPESGKDTRSFQPITTGDSRAIRSTSCRRGSGRAAAKDGTEEFTRLVIAEPEQYDAGNDSDNQQFGRAGLPIFGRRRGRRRLSLDHLLHEHAVFAEGLGVVSPRPDAFLKDRIGTREVAAGVVEFAEQPIEPCVLRRPEEQLLHDGDGVGRQLGPLRVG